MKKIAILLIVGIFVVLGVASFFDLNAIANVILQADFRFLVLAFLAHFCLFFILTEKMRVVVGRYKSISYWFAFRLWMIGVVFDMITPLVQIGGEPLKIHMLKKAKVKLSKASAAIVTDTFVELFTFFIMLVVAVSLLVLTGGLQTSIIISYVFAVIVVTALVFLLFGIVMSKRILNLFANFIEKVTHKKHSKYMDIITNFEQLFRGILKDGKFMLGVFLFSFSAKFMDFIRIYLIFFAFGYSIGIDVIIYVWAIMLLVGMLPGLPGSLGLVESGGIAAYVLFGVPAPIAAAVVLMDRLISFWITFGIGTAVAGKSIR